MSITIPRGQNDPILDEFVTALKEYESAHPQAEIDLYRQSRFSVRIRIVDPDFQALSNGRRDDMIWPYLEKLPEETISDLSMLVLLAPEETAKSFANLEFNDPIPSRI